MPDVITATEYLEIASTPLATPAWRITDLTPLWSSANLRGADRILPLAGVRALPRRATVTQVTLPMVIFGDRDRTNTPYSNARDGLRQNLDALHAAVVDPPGGATGTRTAIWHQAGGATETVALHVLGLVVGRFSPGAVRASLQLSIPTGRFT